MEKTEDIYNFLQKNYSSKQISAAKYQNVSKPSYRQNDILYVESGTLGLCMITPDGEHRILAYYEEKEFFDTSLLAQLDFLETVYLLALTKCSLTIYHTDSFHPALKDSSGASNRTSAANQLFRFRQNLAISYQKKTSLHLNVLMQTSLRTRLLCYFTHRSRRLGTASFPLPFSYSRLAEYLAADRSSMMRELTNMKKDGLIRTEEKWIFLLEG